MSLAATICLVVLPPRPAGVGLTRCASRVSPRSTPPPPPRSPQRRRLACGYMASTAVRRCRRCFQSRRARIGCSAAVCPAVLGRGLRYAVRKPGAHCHPARRVSCGSTHHPASSGTWKIRGATKRAIDADGMFRTGDLARLAGTGFVFEARIGDAMRLGGFLVSPEEIEAVIQAQRGVAGVQVVAASREGADPVPVAFVLPAAG